MPLIVETGSIVPNANAYIDVAYADTYLLDRNLDSEWTLLTATAKEAAIIYATEYLELRYDFKGCLQDRTQSLSFPRSEYYDKEGRALAGVGVIPEIIKQVSVELALRHTVDDLFFTENPSERRIIEEEVDGHRVEFDNSGGGSAGSFAIIEYKLRPYLSSSVNIGRIIRG